MCSRRGFELQIGMRGLTSYAETVSVYGTESVFIISDDALVKGISCIRLRKQVKMRLRAAQVRKMQMGAAEVGMLYLEARCVMITKGAGVQGFKRLYLLYRRS